MHEDRCQNRDNQRNGNADDDTGCNRFFHPVCLLPSKAARRDDCKTVSDAEGKSGHHLINRRAGTHRRNRRVAECIADDQRIHRVVNLLKHAGRHNRQGKKQQRFQDRAMKQINLRTPPGLCL